MTRDTRTAARVLRHALSRRRSAAATEPEDHLANPSLHRDIGWPPLLVELYRVGNFGTMCGQQGMRIVVDDHNGDGGRHGAASGPR